MAVGHCGRRPVPPGQPSSRPAASGAGQPWARSERQQNPASPAPRLRRSQHQFARAARRSRILRVVCGATQAPVQGIHQRQFNEPRIVCAVAAMHQVIAGLVAHRPVTVFRAAAPRRSPEWPRQEAAPEHHPPSRRFSSLATALARARRAPACSSSIADCCPSSSITLRRWPPGRDALPLRQLGPKTAGWGSGSWTGLWIEAGGRFQRTALATASIQGLKARLGCLLPCRLRKTAGGRHRNHPSTRSTTGAAHRDGRESPPQARDPPGSSCAASQA